MNLKLWLNCDVVQFTSAKFALEFIIQHSKSISLIVCRSKCGLEKSSLAVQSFLRSKKQRIPFITMAEATSINAKECNVASEDINTLIKCSASYLKINAQKMADIDHPEYLPINFKFFSFIDHTPNPIYRKVSDENFSLAFEGSIDQEEYKKLADIKEKELFIKKETRLSFVTKVTGEYLVKFKQFLENQKEDSA